VDNLKKVVGFISLISLGLMCSASAQVPSGSYRASCSNIRFDGEQLFAVCADARGRRVPTSLMVRGCVGGIANSNGQLACDARVPPPGRYRDDDFDTSPRDPPRHFGGGQRGHGLPGGSWRASCTSAEMRGPILNAMCVTVRGDYRPATADVRQCPSFSNRNGTLVCGG
jgi:hypothetical protein